MNKSAVIATSVVVRETSAVGQHLVSGRVFNLLIDIHGVWHSAIVEAKVEIHTSSYKITGSDVYNELARNVREILDEPAS